MIYVTDISRLTDTETIDVAAGTFETFVYVVQTSGGRDGKLFIEKE